METNDNGLNVDTLIEMLKSSDSGDFFLLIEFIDSGSIDLRSMSYKDLKILWKAILDFCNSYTISVKRVSLLNRLIDTKIKPFIWVEPAKHPRYKLGEIIDGSLEEYKKYHKMSVDKKIKFLVRKMKEVSLD